MQISVPFLNFPYPSKRFWSIAQRPHITNTPAESNNTTLNRNRVGDALFENRFF